MSKGVIFPKYRGDLIQTTVVAAHARRRDRGAAVPAQPLDVLSQQIVAMVSMDEWTVDDLESLVKRAAPYATLPGRRWRRPSTCSPGATPATSSASCAPASSGTA